MSIRHAGYRSRILAGFRTRPEEVDICYRLTQAGWGLWQVPQTSSHTTVSMKLALDTT